MRLNSASALALRARLWPTLLFLLVCIPSPVRAVGTLKIISVNGTDIPFGFSISRDNHLAVPYHLNDQYGLYVYGLNDGVSSPGLPAGLRAAYPIISNWGLALISDHNGFTPTDVYAAPRGQQLQLLQSGQGYSDFSSLGLNDQGVVSFLGRATNTHGPDLVFRSQPGPTPYAQLLPPSGDGSYIFTNLDASGRLYTLATDQSTTPFTFSVKAFSDAGGWVNRTAGFNSVSSSGPPGSVLAVNPGGQFTFPATYDSNTKHGIYLATQSGFKFLFDRTSVQETHDAIEATVSISDRGDVLALIGQTSNTPFDKRTLFYTYDGRFIDLQSILPPGKEISPFKVASLSYDGHLLVEARDILSGKWEYYGYDGSTATLLMDLDTRALSPRLANDGLIYFYEQTGSTYSLFQTVPEPSSMLALSSALFLLPRRKRLS